MADSDFDAITNNGSICNSQGNVGPKEFCEIMTKEIRLGKIFLIICSLCWFVGSVKHRYLSQHNLNPVRNDSDRLVSPSPVKYQE